MRKIFTKLFGLALLMFWVSSYSGVSAQVDTDCLTLTLDNVELVTDISTVCDSDLVQYKVTGFPDSTEYSFNGVGDETAAGFTPDSTFWVKEGTGFVVQVRTSETCYSEPLSVLGEDLITPVYVDTLLLTQPMCANDDGELTVVVGGSEDFYVYFVDSTAWQGPDYDGYTKRPGTQFQAEAGMKYYVTVESVNGCTSVDWDSVMVDNAPAALVIDTIYAEDPECIDGDGLVTVVVSGGYGGEYEVTVGGVTETTVNDTAFIAVGAGEYTATAVDSNMCSVVSDSSVVLTDPAPVTFDITLDDIACADSTDGAIYITNIAGPADSSMVASLAFFGADTLLATGTPMNDTIAFTGLKIGYYSVWVNNENDACDSVAYVNPNGTGNVISLQAPEGIELTVVVDTVVCLGDSSTITASATGGSGNLEFLLEEDIAGVISDWSATKTWDVPEGTYMVYVRDADVESCEIMADAPIELEDPDPVVIDVEATATVSPTCPGGNDGVINIAASGGIGTLWYSLDSMSWKANNIFAVAADTFTVYVRTDACENDVDVLYPVIVEPLDENVIAISDADTANECYGVLSNYIEVETTSWASQTGEVRNVTVSITDGADFADTLVYDDEDEIYVIEDLVAGTYTITAEDNMGCVAKNELTVVITEEGQLTISGTVTGEASCYGSYDGEMSIIAGDGEPVLYGHANTLQAAMQLPAAAMTEWPVDADSVTIQVGKGTYYVVAKDACGAKAYAGPFEVDGLEMVTITDTAMSVTDITCYGDSVGVIEVFPAEGGTEEYTYTLQVWDGSTWVDVAPYVDVAETMYDGLPVGDYQVVVTDLGGCEGATTGTISIEGPLSAVTFTAGDLDITCYGAGNGLIEIIASGGTGPYEYKIDDSEWRKFTKTEETPFGGKYVTITEPGIYEVQLRDSLGCEAEDSWLVEINEPDELVVTLEKEDVTTICGETPNGSLEITRTGGNGFPVDIFINDELEVSYYAGSVYTLNDLAAGTYNVKVKESFDSWGWGAYETCEAYASTEIVSPDSLMADAIIIDSAQCFGSSNGEVLVVVTGGTAPYDVQLEGVDTVENTYGEAAFTGLAAGTYTAVVVDSVYCTYEVSFTVNQPDSLTLNATWVSDITCVEAGQFVVAAGGGSGEFMYYADPSVLGDGHIFVPNPDSSGWQMSDTFNVTAPGTYVVWAYDIVNGCMVGGEQDENGQPVNEWRVKIAEPDIVVDVTAAAIGEILCNGNMTDTIVVESVVITQDGVVMVDPVYTVTIDGIETDTLADVGAGTYIVMVTHEGGCYGTDTVEIEQPELLEIIELVPGEGEFTCPDAVEGYIEANVEGGTKVVPPWGGESYRYTLLQDGVVKTTETLFGSFLVTVGHDYQVIVTDANGCTDTSEVLTLDPVAPIEFEIADVTCADDTMASVLVEVTGEEGRMFQVWWQQFEVESGVYTDTSSWFTGSIKLDQMFIFDNENVEDIHYAFTVVDDKGCEAGIDTMTFDQVINAPLELTVTKGVAGDCSTEVTVVAAGGVAPYTVTVNGEEAAEGVLVLGGGTYTIAVTDAHQCEVSEEITIEYGISADTTIETYTGEAIQFVVGEILDTMLYAGEYSFYYDVDTACTAELNVIVTEKDRAMPVLDTVTPQDTIADNHAIFEIVFEDVVTFNDSVMGYLTVTAKDSTEATLEIPITADMVDGNTITVNYDYTVVGKLELNTTYVVEVDSGIVVGDGLAWNGVTGDWMFTTGEDWATDVDDLAKNLEFKVYPNPFNDRIKIKNYDKLTRVVLTNIAGQRVLDIENPSFEIRTGNLTTGVYVVTLISNDEIVKSERIIKR
ncbi:T9SS type A sorting domain-containing protein [Prolixibacteraceae bacterium Z1-6]|uniref:T9SS type A sorting domain-containing protein n=1 Tax=Draconibacterium aestuarii TaxID=2998507 RepID=A0A9X3J5I1_9BACT|nr:T9SS type A sorting domain-containing protein [Prolixibacteraceae bacterium Z1-6]